MSVIMCSHFFSKQGGGIQTSEGVLPTSEGVILTSEGVILTKQAILREIKTIFCAYQHVSTRKVAQKPRFTPQNAMFLQLLGYLLLPNPYTHPQGSLWVHLDCGLGSKIQRGDWWNGGGRNGIFVVVERLRLWYDFRVSRQPVLVEQKE
jgi:hypothetical protein